MLERFGDNPLLTPADVAPTRDDLEVLCTLNPAAVRVGSQTLLLVRVGERPRDQSGGVATVYFAAAAGQTRIRRIRGDDPDLDASDPRVITYRGRTLLTSMSHLRLARQDGRGRFVFDERPFIYPATPYEAYGCEDARITFLDGLYYITYTAVSDRGVCVAMAVTDDFVQCRRKGVIFPPYQKDVAIFPGRVGDMYVCRHRPYRSEFNPASIWTARSPDLLCWGHHQMTLAPAPGTWTAGRVGAGAPPIRTPQGWLEIYHACDAAGAYALGAMLSDLEHPEQIISCSSRPVLTPQADYERVGVYGQCVFSNGLIADEDGRLTVYYGAADRICARAMTTVETMVAAARS